MDRPTTGNNMNFSSKQAVIIGGGLFLAVLLIIIIFANLKGPGGNPDVEIKVWGIDGREAFDGIIKAYETIRPNVTVRYEQISDDNYEDTIIDALASGRGPDIFMIKNRSVLGERDKLFPLDPIQFNLVSLQNIFPQVAEEDFVWDEKIYALPLFIDTLSLVYNRDLFDQAGIVYPPEDWTVFQETVSLLKSTGPLGEVDKAGAAIGGSEKTINNATDILNMIMLQNGTQMVDPGLREATFNASNPTVGNPGLRAFDFYLQFANAGSAYYTWNDNQVNYLESFAKEKTAMVFVYKDDLATILEKNPFINLSISTVPQLQGSDKSVSYARYWGLTVSRQSSNPGWAWDFIIQATANPEVVKNYLNKTNRPAALRSIIAQKVNDPDFWVYSRQALTARSWPQVSEDSVRGVFSEAIANVLSGQSDSARALAVAEGRLTQIMRDDFLKE